MDCTDRFIAVVCWLEDCSCVRGCGCGCVVVAVVVGEEGGPGGLWILQQYLHTLCRCNVKEKVGTACTDITMRQWHWTGWPGYFIIYCALTFGPKLKLQRRLDRLVWEHSLSKHLFMTTHEHHFGFLSQDNGCIPQTRIIPNLFTGCSNEFTVLSWSPQSLDLRPLGAPFRNVPLVEKQRRVNDEAH